MSGPHALIYAVGWLSRGQDAGGRELWRVAGLPVRPDEAHRERLGTRVRVKLNITRVSLSGQVRQTTLRQVKGVQTDTVNSVAWSALGRLHCLDLTEQALSLKMTLQGADHARIVTVRGTRRTLADLPPHTCLVDVRGSVIDGLLIVEYARNIGPAKRNRQTPGHRQMPGADRATVPPEHGAALV